MLFTATQARQQFFHLLRLVEKGIPVTIIYKDTGTQFEVTLLEESPYPQKKQYGKELHS